MMNSNSLTKIPSIYSIALLLTCITFTIYSYTSVKPTTPFDYFTRLSEAFIQGRIYLTENPAHLNELVRGVDPQKWYVVYPPMPAIMAIPFVLLDIADKSQTYISIFFAAINVGLLYIVSQRLFSQKIGIILAIALAIGTNHWYIATEGSAWYYAHICAVFWILTALLILNIHKEENTLKVDTKKRNWFFAGLALGAAYWSRLPAVLIIPFFLYLGLFHTKSMSFISAFRNNYQYCIALLIGIGIFICCNFFYNFARFGTITDKSYELIPGVLDEPWYSEGIFSISYLPKNIRFILFKSPVTYEGFPYYKPSLEGMSLFLTSPFLILLPFIKWKKEWAVVGFVTALFMLIPALLHGTPGFAQFGYRFALEATPLLLLCLGTFLERRWWTAFIPLLVISIAINYWGIYFIRELNIYGW